MNPFETTRYFMIRVGTSGFSFKDWIGPVYPEGMKSSGMISFYERELGFTITEINATYYAIPSPKTFVSMMKKTSPSFEFTVKANRLMTHEIRDRSTGAFIDNTDAFASFRASIDPLVKEGRLTAVLAQFPYSFHATSENAAYIERFAERLAPLPLVVEFRNARWHGTGSLDFLRRIGVGYCVVDEPKLAGLMPYSPAATTGLGYFRLHGRNRRWFKAPASERYDYLYSAEELREFVPDILRIEQETDKTVVMFNNCHAGQAVRNALDLIEMLKGPLPERPARKGE